MLPKIPKPPRGKSRHPSSNVTSHSYDHKTKELHVTFKDDRTYKYSDVSPELAQGLGHAASKGSFLHEKIIGKHPTEPIKG